MRGVGEPSFEIDVPPGSDMLGEIREGPKAAERMEFEIFSRLAVSIVAPGIMTAKILNANQTMGISCTKFLSMNKKALLGKAQPSLSTLACAPEERCLTTERLPTFV